MNGRTVHWLLVSLGPLIGSGLAGAAWAQATAAGATTNAGTASSDTAAPRRYVPPRLGAPDNRVSGATRGPDADAMQLDVLAPPDVGLTARAQPRLYWFNSRPIEGDALITIVDDASDRTVLKATVPGPLPAGINSFSLADTQGRIRDDTAYRWSLTVVLSKRDPSRNPVASGMIERVARPAPRPAADAAKRSAPGLWYR